MRQLPKLQKPLDVLIIGAGIGGLTAGLYAARMKLTTLILEDELVGGQIIDAYGIENYPGFLQIRGSDLIEKIQEQTLAAGAQIDEFDQITQVQLSDEKKRIETNSTIYLPKSVIIAAGMKRRQLPIPEEKQFRGRGIHYCELCDGHLYQDQNIAIVGGGNAAVDAANFLDKYAKKIYIIHRSPKLTASTLAQERLYNNPKVEFLFQTQITQAFGQSALEAVRVENTSSNVQKTLDVNGIFVNIGVEPRTQLYKNDIALAKSGHIIAGETCETNIKGVFAAGDIRTKPIRQLTTAAADGTVAALLAEKYIAEKGKEQ